MKIAFVMMLALLACGGSPEVVVLPEPVKPPVVEPGLPQVQGKTGVVFSPDGSPLELRVLETGASVLVPDGTPLRLINEQSGKGLGRADAEVEVDGQIGILPNVGVLVGDRWRTSPSSKVGLFFATGSCKPDCLQQVWAVHADGRRMMVTDEVTSPTFAFSPDGQQIAVGGAGLWRVMVGPWKVFAYDEFAAPAFAHDSTLYVRMHGESDAVMRFFFGGQISEIASEPGKPSDPVPEPVTFEDGGQTIVAVFARAGGDKTVRVPR